MDVNKVIVVGVDHFVQNLKTVCITTDGKASEAHQRASLKGRLEELIAQHKPQLIAEEEKPGEPCIGKQLADTYLLGYCTLTMLPEEREKVGIRKDYFNSRETRRATYEIFEAFMYDQIHKSRGSATVILVICGSDHLERLANRFIKSGDVVCSEDTYYAKWYRGRPIESDGQLIGFDKERPEI